MTADDPPTRRRDQLRLFGYRMSGSLAWAEGLAETKLLQAGRLEPEDDGDERRMLHGPALERCLAELAGRSPRGLPAWQPPAPAAGTVAGDAGDHDDSWAAGAETARTGDSWLDPFPDALLPETGVAPAGSADAGAGLLLKARETVSLELVGALQTLPVDERAALVLHDLVGLGGADDDDAHGWRSSSDHTDDGVLRSARASFARAYRQRAAGREPPAEPDATSLLMEYIFHWEAGDVAGMARMLTADVVFQSPPSGRWYRGRDAVVAHLAAIALPDGAAGLWRLLPRRANGQLAFGCYRRGSPGEPYRAHSIHVVYFERQAICEIVIFGIPSLFGPFALLPELTAQGETMRT